MSRRLIVIASAGVAAVLVLVGIRVWLSRELVETSDGDPEIEEPAPIERQAQDDAREAAQKGIEEAVSWLGDGKNFQPADGLGSPVARIWLYGNESGSDVGAGMVDLVDARYPSFLDPASPFRDSMVLPHPETRGGRVFFKLRVLDCHSQINLNNPERVVEKLLENLGVSIEKLARSGETPFRSSSMHYRSVPNPLPPAVVGAILGTRRSLPGGVFTDKEQIRRDRNGIEILTSWEFRLVQDYIAVQGWRNDRAVRTETPNASHGNPNQNPRYDVTNRAPVGWWRKGSSVEQVLPSLEPRYPININTAPKAVLVANFMNLDGYHRRYVQGASYGVSGLVPASALFISHEKVGAISFAQAKALAEAVIEYRGDPARGPFRTWDEFILFVRTLPGRRRDVGFLTPEMQDLVIANACPNWMSNLFLPEPQRYFSVSKDLIFDPTCEFCFDSRGHFEISSLGCVRNEMGETVAKALASAEVKVWHLIYRNTQRDFLSSLVTSRNAVTGPESIANTIESTARSEDPLLAKVYGSDLVAAGGNPYEGWIQPLTEGIRMSRAGSDGALEFAFDGKGKAGQTFFAPYLYAPGGRPYDALASKGPGKAVGEGERFTKTAGETVFKGESLMPDGVLCDKANDEELAYAVESPDGWLKSFDPRAGTVEFWVKFTADYERSRDPTGTRPLGAHEPIFYMNHQIQGGIPRFGVTWKLERYGYRIRSTRFFWMTPIPQILVPIPPPHNAIQFLWTEMVCDIDRIDWKGGEWHHIVHSWKDHTDQLLFVDGREGIPMEAVRHAWPTNLRFELVSNDPQLRAFVGGFIYNNVKSTPVYRGFSDPTGWTVRLANCKIDQIRGYDFPVGPDDGRAWIDRVGSRFWPDLVAKGLWPQSRFDPGSRGDSFFEGEIPVDAGGEAVLVSFTTLVPLAPGTGSFETKSGEEADRGATPWNVGYAASSNGSSIETTDTGEYSVQAAAKVEKGDRIRYRISFDATRGANSAPTVDDISIYIQIEPVYLSRRPVLDR